MDAFCVFYGLLDFHLKLDRLFCIEGLQLQISSIRFDNDHPLQGFNWVTLDVQNGFLFSLEDKAYFSQLNPFLVVLNEAFPANKPSIVWYVDVFLFGLRIRRVLFHNVAFLQAL